MPPALIGAAVGVGASVLGAKAKSDAAKDAARAQTQAGQQALDVVGQELDPFADAGRAVLPQLQDSVFQGFESDPQAIIDNPLFQALSKDQEKRLINQQASLGRAGTGETQDALIRNALLLGRDFEQQDFDRQLQESQTRFNQLFGISGQGAQTAAQSALTKSDLITDVGSAKSAGEIAKGNAIAGGIQGIFSSAFGSGLIPGAK